MDLEESDEFSSKPLKKVTDLSDDAKTMIGSVSNYLKRKKISEAEILSMWKASGYDVKRRTLANYRRSVDSSGLALSGNKSTGRPKLLDRDQMLILSGMVLARNKEHEEVNLETVKDFSAKHLGVELSDSTAWRYLNELGFTKHLTTPRKPGYALDSDQLQNVVVQWLKDHRGPLGQNDRLLCSVDFTYTSHRMTKPSTYSPRGGPTPSGKKSIPKYTNCIVTCVWSDGKNRTPPMLYTNNPKFRRWVNPTDARREVESELDLALKKYDIKKERIVHMSKLTDVTRTYIAESTQILRHFFEQYEITEKAVIFSDFGNSFFDGDLDVLLDLGFDEHYIYECIVHHFLSPNDNNIHGVAKRKWRTKIKDHKDDVISSIALLSYLDEAFRNGPTLFEKNLQIGIPDVDIDKVKDLVGNKRNDFETRALFEYRVYMRQDAREYVPDVPEELKSALDGLFWN